MTDKNKPFTWQQLKEYANSLNEIQLSQPVRWWGDERAGQIRKAEELESAYIKTEFYEPVKKISADDLAELLDGTEDIIYAGTPILYVD